MSGGTVELLHVSKRFADVVAVDDVSLTISPGEFFSLLGPSGCGKTTSLRMVAGFEYPSSGRIVLDGADVTDTPPNRRNVNTVFQSYALFPFLDVAGNVGFGLRYTNASKAEITRRVGEALELVRLSGYEKRRPNQLSGGQQQRVALARALVLRPSVLLLDEPLGALDAKLRRALQVELKALQEHVGITFVFVTHDQEEALTMSDRLAVMSGGQVVQMGAPQDVYENPATAYVADFLGVSNLLAASVARAGSASAPCELRIGDVALESRCGAVGESGAVRLAIRPERVVVESAGTGGANRVPVVVERTVFLGSAVQIHLRLATGESLQALVPNDGTELAWASGSPAQAHLPADALRVLAPDRHDEVPVAAAQGVDAFDVPLAAP